MSGSATELTRRQLARLDQVASVRIVRLVVDDAGHPDVDATTAALLETLERAGAGETVLLASVPRGGRPAAGSGSRRRARRARAGDPSQPESEQVDGLYLTGGDLAAACLAELAADGLDVTDEVVPLAVAGNIVGGPWSGLPVVTKGGLVGDDDTVVACLAVPRAGGAGPPPTRAARRHPNPLTRQPRAKPPRTQERDMSQNDHPVLALTVGDPVGIGPEITARTLAEFAGALDHHGVAVGDAVALRRAVAATGLDVEVREVTDFATATAGEGVIDVLDTGVLGDRELAVGRGRRRGGPGRGHRDRGRDPGRARRQRRRQSSPGRSTRRRSGPAAASTSATPRCSASSPA